jgi:hypothetical protein
MRNSTPLFRFRSVISGVFAFLCIGLAVALLVGCESIPLPALKLPTRAKRKIPWKDQGVGIRLERQAETRLTDRNDPPEVVKIFPRLIDGLEYGSLEVRSADGVVTEFSGIWQGKLIDVTRIIWPNGESWLLWAWDTDKGGWFRTLSLFLPATREVFSCELEFHKNDSGEFTGQVATCFTWDPGRKILDKYRTFLDEIKPGYADFSTWGKETRGTRNFRQGLLASVSYVLSLSRPLQDYLPGTLPDR